MITPATTENIGAAAGMLVRGEVVAFPTETVYGLGANALDSHAVQKIFELKGRPSFNPLIVHVPDPEQIFEVCALGGRPDLKDRLEKLFIFWPGPLSLVLPRSDRLALAVSAGLDSVAVRVPNHPVALALLKAAAVPVAAPSANKSSAVSPTTAAHVEEAFGDGVPMILDGGPCRVGLESTVLSLLGAPEILRPGAVTREQIEDVLRCEVSLHSPSGRSEEIRSPGLLLKHYAPHTPVVLRGLIAPEELKGAVGYIGFDASVPPEYQGRVSAHQCLSQRGNLEEVSSRLFAALRDFDKRNLDLIVVDTCPESGLGLAIMDRLKRAATGQ